MLRLRTLKYQEKIITFAQVQTLKRMSVLIFAIQLVDQHLDEAEIFLNH